MSGPRAPDEYLSVVIHHATAMICVQVGCDLADALNRLVMRAVARCLSVHDTALGVIDGTIRFDAPSA